MRVGSFLWFLAMALMALGYFVPEWWRLHQLIIEKDRQIAQLQEAVRKAGVDRDNVIANLDTATKNLQACQQQLQQSVRGEQDAQAALQTAGLQLQSCQERLQQSEKDGRDAQAVIQTTGQQLQSCQQQLQQAGQMIRQLTDDKIYLEQQNQVLASTHQSVEALATFFQPLVNAVQNKIYSAIAIGVVALGSVGAGAVRAMRFQRMDSRRRTQRSLYARVTEAEARHLAELRRRSACLPHSDAKQ